MRAADIDELHRRCRGRRRPWRTEVVRCGRRAARVNPTVTGVESFEIGYLRLRVLVRTLPGRQFEVARELRQRLATALTHAGISTVATDTVAGSR